MHEAVKKVLEVSGFGKANPVQKEALDAGLLENKNMVVAAPTASGKTLLAEFSALDMIKKGKKAVYIVPLRALASEKYEDFKEKYSPLGIRVAVSMGDMDKADHWLAKYDLIIITSEKFDSLLRHGIPWVEDIGLVIADEIHLLDSPDRGPTLEVLLTKLRHLSNPKVLALSATINNYQELADWLKAEAVKSNYRPVKLLKGVCFGNEVTFSPKGKLKLEEDSPSLLTLAEDTLKKKKQALVFISTRKGTEATAERVGRYIQESLTPEERKRLSALGSEVLKALDHPTRQCERLSRCVLSGAAFHHAGLTNKQRSLLEKAFREGVIKIICATPTLAAGLNLPAFRVIVRDLKRFSSFRGMDYLPALEIEQMLGRAGRPKYDTEGEGILLTKTEPEAKYAWETYILGDTEKIYSKLGVEPVLRMHVLALIASGTARNRKQLMDFFFKTFYAHQYQELSSLEGILDKVLLQLEKWRFIETGQKLDDSPFRPASTMVQDFDIKPTRVGKRVSELYIDPLTANRIIENMGTARGRGLTHFSLLHIISDTVEMRPLLSIRKGDMDFINEVILKEERHLGRAPDPWSFEYDIFLKAVKTASMLNAWSEESGEDYILEKFSVTPGELRARLERADWLLYSAQELGLLLSYMDILKDIRKTRLRIKYGIREELLPFVRIKGIGRARARKLFNSGLKKISDLRKVPLQSLERVVGPHTARSIKEQLGEA